MEKFIPCSFVNGNPVKYGPDLGYLVVKNQNGLEESLTLTVIRETYYEHPDAPHDAILSVKEATKVMRASAGDDKYPHLYMLYMAQEVCKEICKR